MAIDGYSVQLTCYFLDGTSTAVVSPGEALAGDVVEGLGGFPTRIPGGGEIVNMKLGTITDAAWVAVWGDHQVQVRFAADGDWAGANPFFFIGQTLGGLSISEIWLRNMDNEEHVVTVYAAES